MVAEEIDTACKVGIGFRITDQNNQEKQAQNIQTQNGLENTKSIYTVNATSCALGNIHEEQTTNSEPITNIVPYFPTNHDLSSKQATPQGISTFGNASNAKATADTKNVQPTPKDPDLDAGWAWMVLLGACLLITILGGGYVVGFFNVIFLEVFGLDRHVTAWVGAVHSSGIALFGPLSSLLVRYIGPRRTLILGTFLCATGYLLTYFAQSFLHLFCTFGLLIGIGNGLVYLPWVLVVTEYFDRYRNVAFGIVSGCVGVGTIIFSPLIQYLTSEYGWRGCMLIMAGINLHMVITAALFIPKKKNDQEVCTDVPSKDKSNPNHMSTRAGLNDTMYTASFISLASLGSKMSLNFRGANRNGMTLGQRAIFQDKYSNSYVSLRETDHTDINGSKCLNRSSKSDHISSLKMDVESAKITPKRQRKVRDILCDKKIIIMAVNVFLINGATLITYVHFPDFFISQGASEGNLNLVMAVLGTCSIFCRVLVGLVSNGEGGISVLLMYFSGSGLAALFIMLCPFLGQSLVGQVIFGFGFGFYGNIHNGLMPLMTLELCGTEDLSVAFAVLLWMCGLSGILGPPFAGWLYDLSGNYVFTFMMAGCCCAIGSLIMMAIPICDRDSNATKAGDSVIADVG